jgi:hypothetical protein
VVQIEFWRQPFKRSKSVLIQIIGTPLDDCLVQLFFGVKIITDKPERHARLCSDISHAYDIETRIGEEAFGRIEDSGAYGIDLRQLLYFLNRERSKD